MNLSRNQITFLRDIQYSVKVDMTSCWRPKYIGFCTFEISKFIKLLGDDRIYLLIPIFSISKSLSNATLNLSEPFLINNKSNPLLIIDFIMEQYNSCGFRLIKDNQLYFYFKFKRVWIYSK